MSGKMKIHSLEVQNVKRIKAVKIECGETGLTIVGGKNKQGKTSVLDAIAFALGGQRYAPSNLKRDGSVADPYIKLTMDNGLIVERKGKNAALKVTDPNGEKTGQQLLNEFVSALAIDLPKFMNGSKSEKGKMLLDILGIGAELGALEKQERKIYDERHTVGQMKDRKMKHAEELPCFDGVPPTPITASELIKDQQEILARNGENQRKRRNVETLKARELVLADEITRIKSQLDIKQDEMATVSGDVAIAVKSAAQLEDESTAEIETKLDDIDRTNAKVRANLDKSKAQDDANEMTTEYNGLSEKLDAVRASRIELLNGADMPLDNLTIEDGELIYNGQPWDCMSGAEQLIVGTSIAQKLNRKCGFVLIDKAEQFDSDTLKEFGDYLTANDLQAIATRVSTGDECSIVIEDGQVEGVDGYVADEVKVEEKPKFSAGKF